MSNCFWIEAEIQLTIQKKSILLGALATKENIKRDLHLNESHHMKKIISIITDLSQLLLIIIRSKG